MLRTALRTLSLPLLAAIATALILFVPTALAGSGVGAVFNLGQVNPVDATSTLKGTSAGAQLQVMNASSAAGAFSLYGVLTQAAPGADSAAVRGVNSGTGTAGSGLWGTHQGAGRGVYGTAATGAGIGVYGRHTGSSGTGPGVRGQSVSADGPGVLGVNQAGGPGLSAVVSAGTPPLQVNSATKVPKLNADLLDGLGATAFWQLGGNAGTSPGTDFLGTSDNQALELKVNGARALRLEPNATSPNLIGGFSGNSIDPAAAGATISGGGQSGAANTITSDGSFSTIGGGYFNTVSAALAFLGGGNANTASGPNSAIRGGQGNTAGGSASAVGGGFSNTASSPFSAVAGGNSNTASGFASAVAGGASNTASGGSSAVAGGSVNTASAINSAVAGGASNTASGGFSAIGGGQSNTASGLYSAVAGGNVNTASGNFSLAAGHQAKATDNGSFVWADSNDFDIGSNGANTFTARTTGGARFISAIDATTGAPTAGVSLTAGGGSWSSLSDRAAKRGFGTVDRRRLLNRLDRIPITSWSYKSQKPSIRHLGPMAQDFRSAFGLGEDARHIDTIDEGGVALAAIQGLYRQNQALERRNESLSARLGRLERQVRRLARSRR